MRRTRWALTALVAALLVALAVLTLKVRDDHIVDEARRDASTVAERVAVESTTYDYAHFDDGVKRVLALSTGDFAKQYKSAARTLKDLIVGAQSSAEGTIVGSGVSSASTDRVIVVVFVDQTVHAGKDRVDRSRMKVTVERVRGRWLVSELDLL